MLSLGVSQLEKRVATLAHSATLLTTENRLLRKANETLSKRRRPKTKTPVRLVRPPIVEEAQDILVPKGVQEQIERETHENCNRQPSGQPRPRLCDNCRKPRHNARTCQEDVEMSDVYSFE